MNDHRSAAQQNIIAVAGAAYGVIGADLHIFGDGTPVYLLQRWASAPPPDRSWLRQSPSRMLNARHEVVPFTSRAAELEDLHRWRRQGARLSARWLHGQGGQGKTRLAARFAEETRADGWLVVRAVHGLGTVLPAPSAEDLDPRGHAGVLLVVDYADRWPLSHLTWLFSNALLHRPGLPTRILLLARSADTWPAIRATLANHQADHSSMALAPLPDEFGARAAMFEAARDGFAATFDIADPSAIVPPGPLTGPDMGLTLAVHMAALVAVDAAGSGRPAPAGLAGLTVYLIDREHLHWSNLYGQGHGRGRGTPVIRTPPGVMHRAVLVAALGGAAPRSAGRELVAGLHLTAEVDRLLDDHAVCYPPPAPAGATVLEPLYPDRLAEDFIALALPGHAADYPPAPWSADLTARLLDELRVVSGVGPSRAITFLAAAAERWHHVGPQHLYPLLRADPQLLRAAGSGAMTAVSRLADLDLDVLRAVEPLLPTERHVDLDAGAAAVTTRLTKQRLAVTPDPGRRGRLYGMHGWRLAHAGRYEEALEASTAAAEEYRRAAVTEPEVHLPLLAAALNNICFFLSELGRHEQALDAAREAVALRRQFAENDPEQLPKLALALNTYGLLLAELGELPAALAPTHESLEIRQRLAEADPRLRDEVASSLTNIGLLQARLGELDEALEPIEQAARIYRELADADAARYLPDLAMALNNLGSRLAELNRLDEALAAFNEAVVLRRRLVSNNETAFLPSLAAALNNHGNALARTGRVVDALASTQEAAGIYRRLSRVRPDAYVPHLARVSLNLGNRLAELGRRDDAARAYAEAVDTRQRLARANPAAHADDLVRTLTTVARFRAANVSELPSALAAVDEAIGLLERATVTTAAAERRLDEARQVREDIRRAMAGRPVAT